MIRVGACLSLTGRYAHLGRQALHGLEAWRDVVSGAEVLVEDDESRADRVPSCLRAVAEKSDVILGPYSTRLARVAASAAREEDLLIWNHGGAGDDVQRLAPGHLISVLSPASRYGVPYLARLSEGNQAGALYVRSGAGPFGKQVIRGAESSGLRTVPLERLGAVDEDGPWHLFCAGSFEEDVEVIEWCRRLAHRPRSVCAVAAGVRRFAEAVADPAGIYGVAQWSPDLGFSPAVGPSEAELVARYLARAGSPPDYPAIQAAAAASLAVRCLELAGTDRRETIWAAARNLATTTLFGQFAIDPATGAQVAHETVLLRWDASGLQLVR